MYLLLNNLIALFSLIPSWNQVLIKEVLGNTNQRIGNVVETTFPISTFEGGFIKAEFPYQGIHLKSPSNSTYFLEYTGTCYKGGRISSFRLTKGFLYLSLPKLNNPCSEVNVVTNKTHTKIVGKKATILRLLDKTILGSKEGRSIITSNNTSVEVPKGYYSFSIDGYSPILPRQASSNLNATIVKVINNKSFLIKVDEGNTILYEGKVYENQAVVELNNNFKVFNPLGDFKEFKIIV